MLQAISSGGYGRTRAAIAEGKGSLGSVRLRCFPVCNLHPLLRSESSLGRSSVPDQAIHTKQPPRPAASCPRRAARRDNWRHQAPRTPLVPPEKQPSPVVEVVPSDPQLVVQRVVYPQSSPWCCLTPSRALRELRDQENGLEKSKGDLGMKAGAGGGEAASPQSCSMQELSPVGFESRRSHRRRECPLVPPGSTLIQLPRDHS